MKRILYLSVILSLGLFSCQPHPRAAFSTDTSEPEVGQIVYFDNNSRNADDFDWDFGDGFGSSEINPVHTYTGSGTFDVVLTAKSHNGYTDEATMTISVVIPTLLEIEVLEFFSDDPVAGASVRLYPTVVDWEGETNMESEGYTDNDGMIVFSNLGPWVYYVDVWEQTHDNYQLKSESIDYIRTPEILPNKINRFIAYVDIVDHGKGVIRGSRNYYIKSIVRKDAVKPMTFTGTDDWKALYEKAIKVK